LVSCGNPFSDVPASLLKALDGQVDQFGCGIICWEAAARFRGFSDHPVQAFDGVNKNNNLERWSGI